MDSPTIRAYRLRATRIMKRECCYKHCEFCGTNKKIHVHHIDGDFTNNELWNLIYLCKEHHKYLHSL